MVEIPESVRSIVEKGHDKHPTEPEEAANWAEGRIRKLPDFVDITAFLIHKAVQELLYDVRHIRNVQMKREAGYYGGKAKVISGSSESVRKITQNLYEYNIASTQLGFLLGHQLVSVASNERAIANGHTFNALLCDYLKDLVPDKKQVRDSVSQTKLRNLFGKVAKQLGIDPGDAAVAAT